MPTTMADAIRDITNDDHWLKFSHDWLIRPDTTYLNHGSFGPPPNCVRQDRRQWIDALDRQPMDFYLRQFEPALEAARQSVAAFVGTSAADLVFVENATYGMNVIADSFPLRPGDEVLLNNHEYGAVHRIWDRACARHQAKLRVAQLPEKFESKEQIVDCLRSETNQNTRLVVFSHITSPTALVMPVAEITAAFKDREIAVCIDGPHAPAQVDLDIDSIGCDFYTASCHKWLSASLGSGFLYVHPRWQPVVKPPIQSWGRLLPAIPNTWDEEFTWSGTRDPSPYLSIPAAINFIADQVGLPMFQARSRFLAARIEQMLCAEFGTTPIGNRSDGWYASMAHVPLPVGDHSALQLKLWQEYHIEVPIIHFENRWFIRVSCHLYNNQTQLDTLQFALRKFMI